MNADNIKVSTSIADAKTSITNAKNTLTNLEAKLIILAKDLRNNSWTGETKEKCVDINVMLKEYNKKIEPIIESVLDAVDQLDTDAQDFSTKTTII